MNWMLLLLIVLMSSCASQSGFIPVIDHMNDPNPGTISRDMYECQAIAASYRGTGTEEAMRQGGMGALGGAASGAAIGAIAGNAGLGAGIGAISGLAIGSIKGAAEADSDYKVVFTNCMTSRGHIVLNGTK